MHPGYIHKKRGTALRSRAGVPAAASRQAAPRSKQLPAPPPPPPSSPAEVTSDETRTRTAQEVKLMDLPTEIHLLISKQLIYPDALSLKHTNRHFYSLVDTGVRLKVEWLMERRMLHLECPNDKRCDLGSDLRFCRGSVALLMQRRREHVECESRPGLGCLVYGTSACAHRRSLSTMWKRWMRSRLTLELWWVLAVAAVLLAWLWVGELLRWRWSEAVRMLEVVKGLFFFSSSQRHAI